jgi:hypothetical protein
MTRRHFFASNLVVRSILLFSLSIASLTAASVHAFAKDSFFLCSAYTSPSTQSLVSTVFADGRPRSIVNQDFTNFVNRYAPGPSWIADCNFDQNYDPNDPKWGALSKQQYLEHFRALWLSPGGTPAVALNWPSAKTTGKSSASNGAGSNGSPSNRKGPVQYEWCWTAPLDNRNKKIFYSKVFTIGPTDNQQTIMHGFRDFVRESYPSDNTGPGECDGPYTTMDVAKSYLNQYRTNSRDFDQMQVIDTDWGP